MAEWVPPLTGAGPMPIRDPETGKELGGAEKARRKAAAAGPAVRIGNIFADLRRPPIGNPINAMLWCNDALLLCVDAFMRAENLTPAEMARLRLIMDGCAKAGMIRDKTAESRAMLEALRRGAAQQEAAGLEPSTCKTPPPLIQRPG